MDNKLLIIYTKNGYDIILDNGTPMEFVDGTKTTGFSSLNDAINCCVSHDYSFEIV